MRTEQVYKAGHLVLLQGNIKVVFDSASAPSV